jgi:Fic family protein
MDTSIFTVKATGKVIKTEKDYFAFVPDPLPPTLDFNNDLISILSQADIALGKLAGAAKRLPNPHLLIRPYLRKEAVLSSKIEGTQASLSDLFEAEIGAVQKTDDIKEVNQYVRTMEYGLRRIKEFPLSLRFVRELHQILMEGVRGRHATPGEFRTSQNWIGKPGCTLEEATFVPPPVIDMQKALNEWEIYLHQNQKFTALIDSAIVHYQFEAIHPFLDGNGRIGRLLITLLLVHKEVLSLPLLYLSAFFEKHRSEYYERLMQVSTNGQWNDWLTFFLRGVREQATEALTNADKILALKDEYDELIKQHHLSTTVSRTLDLLFQNPYITISRATALLKTTFVTAKRSVLHLEKLGIVKEISGKEKGRIFLATKLLEVLS